MEFFTKIDSRKVQSIPKYWGSREGETSNLTFLGLQNRFSVYFIKISALLSDKAQFQSFDYHLIFK